MIDLPTRRAILAAGLMGLCGAAAARLTPRDVAIARRPMLATRVPARFSGWSAVGSGSPLLPDEDTQAAINAIYDETLARTYQRDDGPSVMLVVAYGSRQTDSLRAHQPEVCYAAQGFQVVSGAVTALSPQQPIPVAHVYATQGARTEPIAYWMTVDGAVTNFGMRLKLRQMRAGFEGRIPDGFLVRASLIGPDTPESYARLNLFLIDFVAALPLELKQRIAGLSSTVPVAPAV